VRDELRQAEEIDKAGKDEAGDKPGNRHVADLMGVTEKRRKQRQRDPKGRDDQAA
jgi:hypothetical protein